VIAPPVIIDHHALPELLRELIECIGEAAAFRLIEWRGGAYLAVPKRVDTQHVLMEIIGPAAFVALVERFGGETIMLPKNDAVARQQRHQLIRHLRYNERLTVDAIALRVGYTMRRVFQVLGEHPQEPISGSLFD
jgi:hypothetical protein